MASLNASGPPELRHNQDLYSRSVVYTNIEVNFLRDFLHRC